MSSIILVDDEQDLCESLARALRREFPNLSVRHTTDPLEANKWIEQERPKILITDVRMPGISGLELLSIASDRWGVVPTVVMTAFASAELDKALALGTFHYLPKPFRNRELLQLVREIIEKEDPPVGFAGTIAVSMLADIVQLHSLAGSTGILVVETQRDRGEIHFSKGRIVHAIDGKNVGREAFNTVLAWKSGQFHFLRQKVTEETIQVPSSELLIDALRMADEQARENGLSAKPEADFQEDSLEDLFAEFASRELEAPEATISLSGTFQAPPMAASATPLPNANPPPPGPAHNLKATLQKIKDIKGFIGVCIGDMKRKRIMASSGDMEISWESAVEAHHAMFSRKRELLQELNINESIQDIVVQSEKHYQVLLFSAEQRHIYFSLLLERGKANLALARLTLTEAEKELVI